jgi:hypothetical protein
MLALFSHIHPDLPSDFRTSIYSLYSLVRATWTTHLTVMHLMSLIISVEKCKLWNSLFCVFIDLLATVFSFGPNFLPSTFLSDIITVFFPVVKCQAIPVTSHGSPQGCGTSRLPHFLHNRLTDGGEVVSLTRRPAALYPSKIPGTHFC